MMAFSLFGKRPAESDQPTPVPETREPKRGLFDRMKQAVTRTRESFTESIGSVIALTREVDETTLLNLEPLLLAADLGAPTTALVMENLRQRALRTGIQGGEELKQLLKSELKQVLDNVARPIRHPAATPEVIMMVGVNGTGKTTTTGKLAAYFTAGRMGRNAPSCSAPPTPSVPPPSNNSKSGPNAPTYKSSKPSKAATPPPHSTTPAPPPKPGTSKY
jgi:fused signal recognition particle receptor